MKDLEIDGPSTNGLINLNGDGAFVENVVLHATGANSNALTEYGISGSTIVRDSIATASGTGAKAMWFGGQPSHVRNVTAWATGSGSTGLMSYANHFTISMSCIGQGVGNVDLASSIVHGDGKDLQLTKAGDCGPAAVLTVAYSDFTTKGETGATINTSGGHNVSLDPATVFVAPGTDFHELEGAGTIDSGAVDDGTGTADVDDLDRVRGVIDMGAAEFFAPTVAILAPGPGPTFNGAVVPHGMDTTVAFEFGPDTGYGSTSDPFSIAGDEAIHGVSVTPPGLDPGATHHVRLKASQGGVNYTRTVYSADATYTPPATTTPPSTTGTQPPPGGSTAPKCKVPKLKGLTRKRARKRLIRAHCRLGKVRGRKGGKVKSQGRRAGRQLAAGTKVSIRLG